jgi:hypothetical protein
MIGRGLGKPDEKTQEVTISLEQLVENSKNGDIEAAQLVKSICDYQISLVRKKQEVIKGKIGKVTENLSRSIERVSSDVTIWVEVRDVCNEAINLIDPNYGKSEAVEAFAPADIEVEG